MRKQKTAMAKTLTNGIVNGVCVDPETYFLSLVQGKSASDYANVILGIKDDLWRYGIGYQARSSGVPSSRLFLPTHACQDARPLTEEEQHRGVRQLDACWLLTVDTVKNDDSGHPSKWQWVMGGEGVYRAVVSQPHPLPVNPPKPPTPPALAKPEYRGDAYYNRVSAALDADYRAVGKTLDADSGCWFGRVDYEIYVEGMTPEAAVERHKAEWRAALGPRKDGTPWI